LYNKGMGADSLMVLARLTGRRFLLPCATFGALLCLASATRSQDVSVAGTPQQANERIRSFSSSTKSIPHDYVIGNGDLLSITVFDVPELTRDVRVSQTGTVGIPLVPVRLELRGLTELQAEQKIREVLESNGLVTHPEVGVVVKEHKSKPITIVGAVFHPMVYEADRTVTLLEALAEAGGVNNDAGDTVIVNRARAATFVEISDQTPIATNRPPGTGEPTGTDAATNTASAPGAAFPSAMELAPNPTLPSVPSETHSLDEKPHSANSMTINLNELLEAGDMRNNITLQAGDVVTVPHAGIVYVLGAVNRPGGFVVSNDRTQLTALKILSLAGGLTKIAKLSHSYIIRQDAQGKQTETEVDLKKILQRQAEDVQMRASDILYIPDDRVKEVALQAIALAVALGSSVAIYRLAYH
jgi:polysaccharide biosynthesis/export protein